MTRRSARQGVGQSSARRIDPVRERRGAVKRNHRDNDSTMDYVGGRQTVRISPESRPYIDKTTSGLRVNVEAILAQVPLQPLPVTTVTTTYTAKDIDVVILCDATAGAFAVTLPTAVGRIGKHYWIKHTVAGGAISITAAGAELIDVGSPYVTAALYDCIHIVSDGAKWQILADIP